MILHLMFASTVGQIFKPLYELLAGIIAFFYSVIPNFAIAIALLTVVVMIVTAPLTVKSTKSTIAMQRVAPELKKIQAKYKGDRVTLNEEMMKLYKEHGINPAGGCLPMLVQLPVFVVLYGVIRGLTSTVKEHGKSVARPDYVSHSTKLYRDLIASNGHMKAFGLDLGNNLFSHHSSWLGAIPYGAIVAIAIGLQYLQMRQLNSRNPGAAAANPQMQMMQRYMPLIFAVIYIRISAGVNIYFVVSSLCRIGIQEAIFRSGVLNKTPTRREGKLPSRDGGGAAPRRTIMERLADAQQRALEQQKAREAPLQAEIDKPRLPKEIGPGAKPTGTKPAGAKPSGAKPPGAKSNGAPTREPSAADGEASSNGGGSPNGTAKQNGSAKAGGADKSNGAGKPAGAAKRPGGASTNGGAQSGSTKARSNGSPAPKEQPSGQPRSAKKRPRKAR
jgi:YidC/Oxa1 family membrane protein insertase